MACIMAFIASALITLDFRGAHLVVFRRTPWANPRRTGLFRVGRAVHAFLRDVNHTDLGHNNLRDVNHTGPAGTSPGRLDPQAPPLATCVGAAERWCLKGTSGEKSGYASDVVVTTSLLSLCLPHSSPCRAASSPAHALCTVNLPFDAFCTIGF